MGQDLLNEGTDRRALSPPSPSNSENAEASIQTRQSVRDNWRGPASADASGQGWGVSCRTLCKAGRDDSEKPDSELRSDNATDGNRERTGVFLHLPHLGPDFVLGFNTSFNPDRRV